MERGGGYSRLSTALLIQCLQGVELDRAEADSGNPIQASHMGSRNPFTRVISCCLRVFIGRKLDSGFRARTQAHVLQYGSWPLFFLLLQKFYWGINDTWWNSFLLIVLLNELSPVSMCLGFPPSCCRTFLSPIVLSGGGDHPNHQARCPLHCNPFFTTLRDQPFESKV